MGLAQSSFGRAVNIKVFATTVNLGAVSGIEYSNNYTMFSSVQPDGTQGFRIKGRVNKVEAALTVVPNPINIQIFNLGAQSRTLLESQTGTKIIVEAGYGKNPKQIFLGNILWARTHKVGPDYITEIQAGDGSFALTNGQVNLSFSGNTSYQTVIDALIDALAPMNIIRGTITGVPEGGYNQSVVLVGNPFDNLKNICDKLNLHFVLANGAINILPLGQDLGVQEILVSVNSGMIGIPEIRTQGLIGPTTDPNKTTPDNIVGFKMLLRPEMEILQRVKIQSKFINGSFVVGRVMHDFDSWDGPFFTECECIGL